MDDNFIEMDVNDFKEKPEEGELPVTPEVESSTAEPKVQEVAEPTKETEDGFDKAEEKPSEDEAEPVDDTDKEEQPQTKADERKQKLNTEIRDLVTQRNAIKQEVERLNSQVYQPESVQDLVDQGMTEQDARIAAMERKQEISEFNNQVVEAQLTLSSESERVLSDFPIFDPNSKDFKPEIAEDAAQILESNLIKDPNTGQVIGSNVSPYQLYKTIAKAHSISKVEGQIAGQKATEQMLASVDAPTSAAPAKTESDDDPFLKGFDAV
jgi:hypothetical protein